MFAYVGGLVVFLSSLFKIVLHYTFRAIFLFIHWCHVKFGAREGHRASLDLPEIQDNNTYDESIQEPFQYVERTRLNETNVTDNSLHTTSFDACHSVGEGDSIVDVLM